MECVKQLVLINLARFSNNLDQLDNIILYIQNYHYSFDDDNISEGTTQHSSVPLVNNVDHGKLSDLNT